MTTKWLARAYAAEHQDSSHEIGGTNTGVSGLSQIYEADYAESSEEDAEPDIPVKAKGGRPKGAKNKRKLTQSSKKVNAND
jgi:hypothetical protein